jgi:ABC-type cobalt transport system substrate-binding protein
MYTFRLDELLYWMDVVILFVSMKVQLSLKKKKKKVKGSLVTSLNNIIKIEISYKPICKKFYTTHI